MADRSWFIAIGNQQHGPYSEDQFREMVARGAIKPDTYVWADGMPEWKYARDVPGLLSSNVAAPFEPVAARAAQASYGDQQHNAFSINFNIWEMLGRTIVFAIGFLLIIPAPWVATSFYGWVISRVQVPRRGALSFTGKPLDIWYVFGGLALLSYAGASDIKYLNLIVLPLEAFLSWIAVRWVVQNISADRQPLGLKFNGDPWTYIGWNLLLCVSLITIIGWAWVATALMRWICRNIEGTNREITFNATGLEMLWRTAVLVIACMFIIPIPWMLRWYGRWYVSQFAASPRLA